MAPALTEEEAVKLQQELFEAFTSPSFQVKVQDIHAKSEAGLLENPLTMAVKTLALQEQKKVLPKYGFEASAKGVQDMMDAYRPYMSHPQVNAYNYKVNSALFLPPQLITISEIPKRPPGQDFSGGYAQPIKGTYVDPAPVPLPGEEGEIKMLVFHGADVGDVRKQLAQEQGVPVEKIVLAKKPRGGVHGLMPLKDDEQPEKHMKVKGIEKLRRANFSRDRALALQKELLMGFTSPDIQEKIKQVQADHAELRDGEYMKDLKPILREVQFQVLPRHNYEATDKGVAIMIEDFAAHMGDQEIAENTNSINDALGLKNKAVEAMTRTITLQPFVHPTEPGAKEVKTLEIAKAATVLHLKEQLAKELRIPMKNLKLVGKKGKDQAFTTLLDTEKPTKEIKVQGITTFVVDVLSKEGAMGMLADLTKAFKSPAFTSKVKSSIEALPADADVDARNKVLKDLVFGIQVGVLPNYGFRGTAAGLAECQEAFIAPALSKDPDVQGEQDKVQQLILDCYKVARTMEIPNKADNDPAKSSSAEVGKPDIMAFLTEVLDSLRSTEFGFKTRAAQLKSLSDEADLGKLMTEAVNDVQMNFLPKYGFQGSAEGLEEYNQAMAMYLKDPEISALLEKVNMYKILGTKLDQQKPSMTHERAVTLQQELLDGFSTPEFQEQLKKIRQDNKDEAEVYKRLKELALTVQQEVLPRYGFEGSQKGVSDMLAAFVPLLQDELVRRLTVQINAVLTLTPEYVAGAPP